MRAQKPLPQMPGGHPYRESTTENDYPASVITVIDRLIKYTEPDVTYTRLDIDPRKLQFRYKGEIIAILTFLQIDAKDYIELQLSYDRRNGIWFKWKVPKSVHERLLSLLNSMKAKIKQDVLESVYRKLPPLI